jgi:hypothetical protein
LRKAIELCYEEASFTLNEICKKKLNNMELDKYEKLKELKTLLDINLITQDEFQALKREVLDGIEKQTEEVVGGNNKIKDKANNNLFRNIVAIVLLLVGSYYIFNFAKNKDLNNTSITNLFKSTIKPDTLVSNNSDSPIESKKEMFQGQELKIGEKIIIINWGKENKTNYTIDVNGGSRYVSNSYVVPQGKKWVLLYINEDFTFESGEVIGAIPDLFFDSKLEGIHNREFSNPVNINLSKAKDEYFKYYSGSTIKAISSRRNGNGIGENFKNYKGELWFLEINN